MQQVGEAGRIGSGNGAGTIVADNAAKDDRKDSEKMSPDVAVGSDSNVMDRLDGKGVVA